IPADGGGNEDTAAPDSPLAGVKPAPQGHGPARALRPAAGLHLPCVGPGSSRPTAVGTRPRLRLTVRWPAWHEAGPTRTRCAMDGAPRSLLRRNRQNAARHLIQHVLGGAADPLVQPLAL